MNKWLWNTIYCLGNLPREELEKMATHSYELVERSLPKREREKLMTIQRN